MIDFSCALHVTVNVFVYGLLNLLSDCNDQCIY
jgi:hypothetical protein